MVIFACGALFGAAGCDRLFTFGPIPQRDRAAGDVALVFDALRPDVPFAFDAGAPDLPSSKLDRPTSKNDLPKPKIDQSKSKVDLLVSSCVRPDGTPVLYGVPCPHAITTYFAHCDGQGECVQCLGWGDQCGGSNPEDCCGGVDCLPSKIAPAFTTCGGV